LSDVNVAITAVQNAGSFNAIFSSSSGRMDWAQVNVPSTNVPVTSGSSLVSAFQATDPRIKPSLVANWNKIQPQQLGTLIAPTTSTGNGTSLPGDGVNDTSCHIVAANLPNTGAGATGRQRGQMCPSELAYIHTGIPWRTLWLEPQPSVEGNVVPDWLAVDLFSGSSITNVDVPGRMNINAAINNVVNPTGGTILPRLAPLDALLGLTYMTEAADIYDYSVRNTPSAPSFLQLPNKAFTTAGQVCEVVGLADGSGQKATRELGAQEILNLVTPRSNTFTIWCVAQSVKKVDKTPFNLVYFTPGVDVVTGEAKVQAIVERTVDTSSGTPQVKLRTLYYRYLYQ
jgi:hypothetical protein